LNLVNFVDTNPVNNPVVLLMRRISTFVVLDLYLVAFFIMLLAIGNNPD